MKLSLSQILNYHLDLFLILMLTYIWNRWNAQFKLSYRLILREKELHLNIAVYNRDPVNPLSFNLLLHTYFKCPDVRRCQVTGLNGCTFIDKTREPPNTYQECRDVVVIGEWTDRIYANTPNEHIITNVVSGNIFNFIRWLLLMYYKEDIRSHLQEIVFNI